MQKFEFLRQPLLGELAMSRKKEREKERREKNAIYSGHLRLCQQPRAAHALRSDQNVKLHIHANHANLPITASQAATGWEDGLLKSEFY